jgi:hypothetical protein
LDWDVINEIHASLCNLPFQVAFTHIKGHQDTNTAYDKLPLLAQLNIDADELATTKYQETHGQPHPRAPLFSHASCHLQL